MTGSEAPDTVDRSDSPRARLINVWTLIILLLSAVVALWLVAPSRDMLINIIANSSASETSLAFLEILNDKHEMSPEILLLMSNSYLELGNVDKADNIVQSLITEQQAGPIDWEVYKLHLKILSIKMYQKNGNENGQGLTNVRNFLKSIRTIPDPKIAREFANTAVSISMPDVAYRYLYPHIGKAGITEQELSSLALNNSNYPNAFKHQLKLFIKKDNLEELNNLVAIKVMSGKFNKEMGILFDHYSGKLIGDPEFQALSTNATISLGDVEKAKTKTDQLIELTKTPEILSKVSEVAIDNNMFDVAEELLIAQIDSSPDQQTLQKLHDLYLWESKPKEALEISKKLILQGGTETQIRQAIDEAMAIGDLYSEGQFYIELANKSKVRADEYDKWIDTIEKSLGTPVAYTELKKLLARFPDDPVLIGHLARIHSYLGDYQKATDDWQKILRLKKIDHAEALLFSKIFILLQQPDSALDTLLSLDNWINSDQEYIQSIFDLAWQLGRKDLAKKAQSRLRKFADSDAVSSEEIYHFIQLYGPFSYKDIDRLVTLYQKWESKELLLLAIELAEHEKDTDKMNQLISLANKDKRLSNNQDILSYNLSLAIEQKDTPLVKELFTRLMKVNPNYDSVINVYLWWLIDSNQLSELDQLYSSYRERFHKESKFWLVFAAASEKLGYLDDLDYWYRQLIKDIANNNKISDGVNLAKTNSFTDAENAADIILSYANLLDLQGKKDIAFRLRKYVASTFSEKLLSSNYYSLTKLFAGKNKALTLLEKNTIAQQKKDQVIQLFAEFLDNGRIDNLLFWQQRSNFSKINLPDWQKLSIAIKKNDRKAMSKLILESISLPVADKSVALQRLGRHKDAWQHGQEKLGRIEDKISENQLRLTHVTQHPMNARGIGLHYESFSPWDIDRVSGKYFLPINEGHLKFEISNQQADIPKLAGQSIEDENRLKVSYRHKLQDSEWSVKLDAADGVGKQRLGVFADYTFNPDRYWQIRLGAGLDDAFESSQLLTLAGKDNHLLADITYNPTQREEFTFHFNFHDLSNRFGDDIGQGWDMTFRASEKLFFADPSWQLYGEYTTQRYNLKKPPLTGISSAFNLTKPLFSSDFIDEKYSRLSIGQRLSHGLVGVAGATTPSPRYWLDTSVGYNRINKAFDFSLSSGLGWRILGNDELYFSLDWQSSDLNGDNSIRVSSGYNYTW